MCAVNSVAKLTHPTYGVSNKAVATDSSAINNINEIIVAFNASDSSNANPIICLVKNKYDHATFKTALIAKNNIIFKRCSWFEKVFHTIKAAIVANKNIEFHTTAKTQFGGV